MRKKMFKLSLAMLLFIMFIAVGFMQSRISRAANQDDVVINEVAWMGTTVSANDEWIELKNMTNSEVVLDSWTLNATDGTPSINLSGSIPADGYFLLERSDDNSAPDVAADLIYSGALSNTVEVLELRDSENNLIDSIDASLGWPAGDNDNKLTMELCEAGAWGNSATASGTPNAINSCSIEPEPGVCGNNILEEGEECDDGNNNDDDGCSALCILEEEDDCGDGVVETDEECDGSNFGGFTCADYGFDSGNLTCSFVCEVITDSCTVDEPEDTPREIKESVLSLLEGVTTKNKRIGKKLERILNLIEKSLADNLWLDEDHLEPKKGKRVFIYESLAILKINQLLNSCNLTTTDKDKLAQAITDLVKADKLLAEVALNEAKDIAVNNIENQRKYDRLIFKAQAKYNKALQLEATQPRWSVYFFRKTWEFAQKAMRIALLE